MSIHITFYEMGSHNNDTEKFYLPVLFTCLKGVCVYVYMHAWLHEDIYLFNKYLHSS